GEGRQEDSACLRPAGARLGFARAGDRDRRRGSGRDADRVGERQILGRGRESMRGQDGEEECERDDDLRPARDHADLAGTPGALNPARKISTWASKKRRGSNCSPSTHLPKVWRQSAATSIGATASRTVIAGSMRRNSPRAIPRRRACSKTFMLL